MAFSGSKRGSAEISQPLLRLVILIRKKHFTPYLVPQFPYQKKLKLLGLVFHRRETEHKKGRLPRG